MPPHEFADRIRQRYPEGLTGVFAVGGTRTTYILEQNRQVEDPGRITDFAAHGEYLLRRYWQLLDNFFDLGGQNAIVTMFSFRGFHNRGSEYASLVNNEMLRLIGDNAQAYYHERDVDPYFAGIEPFKLLPDDYGTRDVAEQFEAFQQAWDYREGRHKLIWEMASIPLFTFWQADLHTSPEVHEQLMAEVEAQTTLEDVYRVLYRHFCRAAYGTDLPMPHFYLGTNKSGDLKWRSPMPLALSGGDYLRMFFTPYPTLFITQESLQALLEDLAFNKRFFSDKTDYSGKYSPELVQAEYDRVMELSSSPEHVLGLARRVE